jgi:hypothetical protein
MSDDDHRPLHPHVGYEPPPEALERQWRAIAERLAAHPPQRRRRRRSSGLPHMAVNEGSEPPHGLMSSEADEIDEI